VPYEGDRPVGVERVVFSTQHAPGIAQKTLIEVVQAEIIDPIIPTERRTAAFSALINPTGRFEIGGPEGDTGLTGRKIIVDTYGGSCPHGGGAFSGKDPTKVDRSAAYMARYLANTWWLSAWLVAVPCSLLMQLDAPSRCRCSSIFMVPAGLVRPARKRLFMPCLI